jgi:hypothetical protein
MIGLPATAPAMEVAPDGWATYSLDQRYRYTLGRVFGDVIDGGGPAVLFVMLNPSTATATELDPTVRRCVGFARSWGARRLVVVNLFALRSTDPRALDSEADPIGPHNDAAIAEQVAAADIIVAAWGASYPKRQRWRPVDVYQLLAAGGKSVECLGTTGAGEPRHPLYLASASPRRPYTRSH